MNVFKEKGFCKKHGEFEKVSFTGVDGAEYKRDECEECRKKSWAEEDLRNFYTNKETEQEIALQKKKALSSLTKLPKRFEYCTFERTESLAPEQQKIVDVCKSYAEKFDEIKERGTSMVFCGKTGTGKTHIASAIINYIKENHYEYSMMTTVSKLIRAIRSTYSNKSESEADAIERFCKPSLLVIDEVGVQFGTDAEKVNLFDVINERYERMLPTILIGNLTLSEFKDYMSERVIDRMRENGGRVLVFNWESKR